MAAVRKVAFLVLPQFSNLGLAAATEPLFVANWLAQRIIFDWRVVSVDGRPVPASNGRSMSVDGALDTATGCKTVFVLSSFDADLALAEPRAVRWLRRIARFGVEIGGIENGTHVLAEAGLLNGRRAAVHWDNIIGFQERYPDTGAVSQLFVLDRDRITCAGAAAILDLMVAWIARHADADLAGEVAEHLLLGAPRVAQAAQRAAQSQAHAQAHAHAGTTGTTGAAGAAGTGNNADPVILRARAIMGEHIDEPVSCGEIARRVGLSLRQIERRFKDQLRSSVLQQYRQIRIAKAHQLLQQTGLSVTEIAFACGFASPEYFCRLYRSVFGCSPSRDRRQSTTAPVLRRPVTPGKANVRRATDN